MANINRVNGFSPVRMLSGAPWNGATMKCSKAAGTTVTHDLMVGDLVIFSATADARGYPGVIRATAGDAQPAVGVITGFEPNPDHLDRAGWVDGADAATVHVCVDPMVVYEAQADEAVEVTSVGLNLNMVQTSAGSRVGSGCSGQQVDGTIGSSLATWQLKLIGFPDRPDNAVNALYNKVLVIINNHIFKGHTGTAAI